MPFGVKNVLVKSCKYTNACRICQIGCKTVRSGLDMTVSRFKIPNSLVDHIAFTDSFNCAAHWMVMCIWQKRPKNNSNLLYYFSHLLFPSSSCKKASLNRLAGLFFLHFLKELTVVMYVHTYFFYHQKVESRLKIKYLFRY